MLPNVAFRISLIPQSQQNLYFWVFVARQTLSYNAREDKHTASNATTLSSVTANKLTKLTSWDHKRDNKRTLLTHR